MRGRRGGCGLETHRDSAGNCSVVLRSAQPGVRTLKDAGVALPVHVEAIDFSDAEGTLVGELGSSALAGYLSAAEGHPNVALVSRLQG